jgi:putative addiction module killer protein
MKVVMKKWCLEYWSDDRGKSPIEKWLSLLDKEQLQSVAKELEILKLVGNDLKMPHSKTLGGGLFELRERRYGYRIYYGFCGNQVIILLAAGDKGSQDSDIKIARKRLLNLTGNNTHENKKLPKVSRNKA